ncbi:FMNH2-dependent alkanesulfonate monooxygenase [Jeotgalibacillus sp. ET6]|uniref:FMNH2-dependent alkanesulfonate monooxygenase n=1 Tax=Jeotgalibacillus sp. ET6 TaxID=3037260 RepID=UPI0024187417|nr:FMNH2-dependent alkanesulfonate monooxygenase [Jeotgalibacillus sp. ET6]MDG5470462.1 FMNH2-dependent alkanesulfonate monooxygenase [Jeotgalibacillus sp. ET6]
MNIFWFLPTAGDSRYLGTTVGKREVTIDYLQQVAQAVDRLGFDGALLPTGRECEDSWVVASSLIPLTERMKFLVAIRPGLTSPAISARMAATFDRISGGRVLLNIVQGGNPVELAGEGLHLSHSDRYKLTNEFLTVWRKLYLEESVQFKGDYLDIRDGKLGHEPVQKPHPPLYLGGTSESAYEVASEHVDYYLTWGEPVEIVKERIQRVRKLAEEKGRKVKFGIRFHVIVRETEEEAWKAANNLIKYVDDEVIEKTREKFKVFDSSAQTTMTQTSLSNKDSLEIRPGIWAGIGLAREGAGTAFVGDPHQVAENMRKYEEIGIDTFILSGYPHLEEAYNVAELLFPVLNKQK